MEEMHPGPRPEIALPGRKGSFLRSAWRFFKWTVSIVLGLVIVAISLVFIFEDEVKDIAVKELNRHLAAEVKVKPEDIDLTIFSTFPNAGIEFSNVIVFEALKKKNRDTLIAAGNVSLQFSLMDLFDKKYDIKKIMIRNASANFLTDKVGRNNFNFLKDPGKSDGEKEKSDGDLKFRLEKIEFMDVEFRYRNSRDFTRVHCKTDHSIFSGAFSNDNYAVNAEGKIFFDELTAYRRPLLRNKNLVYRARADVNGKSWSVTDASLSVNQLNLFASGKIMMRDTILTCDIDLAGKDVDVRSALSLLPESQAAKIKDYESQGNFYFRSKLKGELTNFEKLAAEISFGVSDATIQHLPSQTTLSHVNLTGRYVKPKDHKDELRLDEIRASMNSNFVRGKCKLTDLSDPFIELQASVNAELGELIKFYPIDTIESLSGKIAASASITGFLKDLKNNYAEQKAVSTGEASVENLCLLFRHSHDSIQVRSGSFEIRKNDLRLKDVALSPGDNDLLLNGELNNFFAWLLKENEPLDIKGNARSGSLKIDKFLALFSGEQNVPNSSSGTLPGSTSIKISEKFNLDFEIQVATATWDKFQADNVSGRLKVKDGKMFAEDLSLRAFDGDVNFTGMADASGENIIFKGSAELVAVNINKMFSQLNNFNQEIIQDKHLKGIATVALSFSTSWNQRLDVDPNSILVASDALIERGELIDYKPLEALAKYVDLAELKRIKFSTLKSHVEIRDQAVLIGRTEITNSAMNLVMSGTHKFNNDIDYHMSILMSELMAKKPGKKKELNEELAAVENDPENRRTVFIRMTGNIDDIQIKYDRKAAKEKIKEDIKKEKQNLKMILKEEFGLFKKDTLLKNPVDDKKKKADQKFIVDLSGNKDDKRKKKEDEEDDGDF